MAQVTYEIEEYTIVIDGYDLDYSYGLDRTKRAIGPVREHYNLTIRGDIVSPVMKGPSAAEITIIQEERLIIDDKADYERMEDAIAIGEINTRNDLARGIISMPRRGIALIMPPLVAGRSGVRTLTGDRLKWRKAKIRDIRFAYPEDLEGYLDER